MTIGELIARVTNIFSRGLPTEDKILTPRHVYNKLLTARARLISEEIKKKQKISQWNYQTLNCVELIKVDKSECICILPSGCEISRSKYRLPKPLTGFNSHIIQQVTTLTGDQIFSEVTIQQKKYKSANKYTANKPDFYIKDGYLYLTHNTDLKVISITGLFEDVEEVKNYPQLCENNISNEDKCISILDKEFPIDMDKIDILVDFTLRELSIMFGEGQQAKRSQNNNTGDGEENS